LVDLVADGAEVGPDGAEVGAAGDGEAWRRSRAFRSWVTAPVLANRVRPRMKSGSSWERGSSVMAMRRAVTWSTALPRAPASAVP
jgi:hypothetical protein